MGMRTGLIFGAAVSVLVPHPAAAQLPESEEVACTVGEVAVYSDRVHVFCSAGGYVLHTGTSSLPVPYFAVETDSPLAAQLVTIASAATISRRDIAVTFSTDWGLNPAGCMVIDCRRLLAVKGFGG